MQGESCVAFEKPSVIDNIFLRYGDAVLGEASWAPSWAAGTVIAEQLVCLNPASSWIAASCLHTPCLVAQHASQISL